MSWPTTNRKKKTRIARASQALNFDDKAQILPDLILEVLAYNMAALGDLGLNVGETASSELREFMKPLLPYAATSDDGVKIRKEGFRAADPNGEHESKYRDQFIMSVPVHHLTLWHHLPR